MIDSEEYRERKKRNSAGLSRNPDRRHAQVLTYKEVKVATHLPLQEHSYTKPSPFCDPSSKRPCVTVCEPPNGLKCPAEIERQGLIRALSECGSAVTIGKMKAGCLYCHSNGPLVGFPHKEFFYIGLSQKDFSVLSKGFATGQILFDRLSVNSLRVYRNDIHYDRETGFLAAIDEQVCIVQVARYFLVFEEGVTCGKCIPCRIGVKKARESIDSLVSGRGGMGDIENIRTICELMKKNPDCDYASSAMRPVERALACFEEEFSAHVQGRCPAGVCFSLTD